MRRRAHTTIDETAEESIVVTSKGMPAAPMEDAHNDATHNNAAHDDAHLMVSNGGTRRKGTQDNTIKGCDGGTIRKGARTRRDGG
jgi:hypothetical protein